MKHYKQPNRAACFPTCIAMILERSPDHIMVDLGHNGLKVEWPELPPPKCYLGFNQQEISLYMSSQGYAMQQLYKEFGHGPDYNHMIEYECNLVTAIKEHDGPSILGLRPNGKHGHVVVWDGKRILNPNGSIQNLLDVEDDIETIWRVFEIKSK